MPLSAVPRVLPLDVVIDVDGATWAALAVVLSVVLGALSWSAFRRRGPAAGLRGLAWALVPLAAWLTGTLKLASNVLTDVANWAIHLVFSPVVWLGIVLAGGSAALFLLSGVLRARGIGVRGRAADKAARKADRIRAKGATPLGAGGKRVATDDPFAGMDDMADIEAILKKHGI